ncbi:hypothetical protein [Micromonospora sp. DT201]|uniref:hypothetical protein n=1 Tax=Micromonospora sp. DT201 TaxID=3393442 RepID=UPI003CEA4B83
MWATISTLLATYLALRQFGVAEERAADWADAAAVLVAVLLLWRAMRIEVLAGVGRRSPAHSHDRFGRIRDWRRS